MASKYYDSVGKEVNDGNVAYASDLNDVNTAIDSALQLVEFDVDALGSNQTFYADLAQKWAENPVDTEVEPGKYSSLHWATKAEEESTAAIGSAATATTAANTATTQAGIATTKASEASASEIAAAASAVAADASADSAAYSASVMGVFDADDIGRSLTVTSESTIGYIPAVPVGSIIPYIGGYFTNGSNGGFTIITSNSVSGLNSILNTYGWYVCNGAALNLGRSPFFNGSGRYLPNISDSRFLMGSTSVGAVGGVNDMSHTHAVYSHVHTISHKHYVDIGSTETGGSTSVNTGSTTLTSTQIPAHTHTYDRVYLNANSSLGTGDAGSAHPTNTTGSTGGGGSHSHSIAHTHFVNPASTLSGTPHDGTSAVTNTGSSTQVNSGPASVTENRPLFLSCFYIMKVA